MKFFGSLAYFAGFDETLDLTGVWVSQKMQRLRRIAQEE
jgi:hypothetical protein